MKRFLFLTCLFALAAALLAAAEDDARREELGKSEKLRILVDKVMQPQAHWTTEEWMVQAAGEAGFNVFSPRAGFDNLAAVEQVSDWCAKYGMYHLPWMRGSLDTPLANAAAEGKRMVWADGTEQPLWSPNADEFWEWTARYVVEYARLSVEHRALMGVFLDYENYAPNSRGNLYGLSYDAAILAKFAAAENVEIPSLEPAKRKAWLDERGLHDRFAAFQIAQWRERCRALRDAVDQLNPAFQFCVYPAPGTPFMVEAVYPEWASERAPLILADACTYGRPGRFIPEAEAVEGNRKRLLENRDIPLKAAIPFFYTGGIDPVVRGADPEFCGKNAVMISEATAGYWIFYEGPTYTKDDHQHYWKWFTWANRAIAEGRFDAQRQARETPETWFDDIFNRLGDKAALAPPPVTGEKVDYPAVKLRGDNLLLVAGKQGMPVEIVLKHHPLANYESSLVWEIRNQDLARMDTGAIAQNQTGAIAFTPDNDAIYVIAATAGACAYSILSSTAPLTIYAGDDASFIGPVPRLFFSVPEKTASFTVRAEGQGRENVRVNVFDASGAAAATGQTTTNDNAVDIRVECGNRPGGIWSLETAPPGDGVIEDYSLTLDANGMAGLSLAAQHVFANH